MEFMNDLLEREAPSMKNFLQLISVNISYDILFYILISDKFISLQLNRLIEKNIKLFIIKII